MSQIRSRYAALALLFCLIELNVALHSAEDVGRSNSPNNNFKLREQCYNPDWCLGVLSVRESSNRSQCCKHLHTKIDCLTDKLDGQTSAFKSFNLSSVKLENLYDNFTAVQSQYNLVRQELENLSRKCSETKNTVIEIREHRTHLDILNERFDSLHRKTQECDLKCHEIDYELSDFKRRTLNIDEQLVSLKQELALTQKDLNSSKLMLEVQNDETASTSTRLKIAEAKAMRLQKNLHTINHRMERISELLKNDAIIVNKKLLSIDERSSTLESNLDSSLAQLKSTFKQSQTDATHALDTTSNELKTDMRNFEILLKNISDHQNGLKVEFKDDIEKQTESLVHLIDHKLKEKSDEFNSKISELSRKHDVFTGSINIETNKLTENLKQIETDLKRQIEMDTGKVQTYLEHKVDSLDSKLTQTILKSDLDVSETHKKILEIEEEIQRYKTDTENQLKNTKNDLTESINSKVAKMEESLSQLDKHVEQTIGSLKTDISKQIKNEVEKLAQRTEAVNQTVTQQKQRVDVIYPNVFNREMLTIAFFLLVILVAINYVIVYSLVKRSSHSYISAMKTSPSAERMNEGSHSPVEDSNRILRQIPKEPELESGVCIISFDESRTIEYRRQLDSANIPNCRVQEHVIRRHEQIPRLPRCQVYLMCTEFSERNVIIEEPGLGLGDLRRTTYDAVQKLGGCLIILYTRDPGSRRLSREALYNTNIHCVTHQSELSTLNDDGRFLSIYDKLTDHQKTHLRNKIVQNMTIL